MKSERRHELETNDFALWLRWKAPELLQKHGSKILLAVVVLALAIVLIRYRINAPKVGAQNAAAYLAIARDRTDELRSGRLMPADANVIVTSVKNAMEQSKDPKLQAEANVVLGNYYWVLANYPELPGAATQPQLRPDLPEDELLKKAEEAYGAALKTGQIQPYLFASAHFGLAGVAENRGYALQRKLLETKSNDPNPHWEQAREHYQAIADAGDVPPLLKDQARARLELLPTIQDPVWMVPATQPAATQSTTQPTTQQAAMTQPFALPVTLPSGARPTTRPDASLPAR